MYFRLEVFKKFLKKEGQNLKAPEVKEILIDNGAEYIRKHKEYTARLWKISKPKFESVKDRNVNFNKKMPSFDPDNQ